MEQLRLNLIQPGANLAGGTKSGRLLMEAMVRRGHEVRILYPAKRPLPQSLKPKAWRRWWEARSQVRSARHHLATSTATLIPVDAAVVREGDAPDADMTIANFWKCREWMDGWSHRTGVPGLFIRGHVAGRYAARIAEAYRMAGVNFVASQFLQEVLARDYEDSSSIYVPNGLDPCFTSMPRHKQERPTAGFMFQAARVKGPDTVRQAIEEIRSAIPEVRVIAFGAGRPTERWPLPEAVEFLLRPAQAQIPEIYQQCDVWLLPSRHEGFGMPGLEAFGCHTPVVSTRCGGPEAYVEDGVSGYLVPVEDHEAMAERAIDVLRLPEDEWRAMSEAGYRRSREFSWDRSAEVMEEAIGRILSGEHPIRG